MIANLVRRLPHPLPNQIFPFPSVGQQKTVIVAPALAIGWLRVLWNSYTHRGFGQSLGMMDRMVQDLLSKFPFP